MVFAFIAPAAARAPLFVFEPTLDSYGRLWLDSTPDNLAALDFGLTGVVVLVLLGVFAERMPIPRNIIYVGILAAVIAIIWGIPKIVDTAKFYDYFMNSLIVSVGAVAISVSIGCLSGYALARYSGMSGVVMLGEGLVGRGSEGLSQTRGVAGDAVCELPILPSADPLSGVEPVRKWL